MTRKHFQKVGRQQLLRIIRQQAGTRDQTEGVSPAALLPAFGSGIAERIYPTLSCQDGVSPSVA